MICILMSIDFIVVSFRLGCQCSLLPIFRILSFNCIMAQLGFWGENVWEISHVGRYLFFKSKYLSLH